MNKPPRIILVGFMGAGKTTAARVLARLLEDSAVSLDQLIAEAEGCSPRALIDEEGEDYFRTAETRALRRALESGSARIVDAGGGAWTVEANRDLAARHNCLAVWLDAPFELCWSRIAGETGAGERPLARNRQKARELYEARRALYALAPSRVEVREGTSAEEVAAEIKMLAEQFTRCARGGRLKEEG